MATRQRLNRPTNITDDAWAEVIFPGSATGVLVQDPVTGTASHLVWSAADGAFKGGSTTPTSKKNGPKPPKADIPAFENPIKSVGLKSSIQGGVLQLDPIVDKSVGADPTELKLVSFYSSERALGGPQRSGWVDNTHKWLSLGSNAPARTGAGRPEHSAELLVLLQSSMLLNQPATPDARAGVGLQLAGHWFTRSLLNSSVTITNALSKTMFYKRADGVWVPEEPANGSLRQNGQIVEGRIVTLFNDPMIPSPQTSPNSGLDSIALEFVEDRRSLSFAWRNSDGAIQTFSFVNGFEDESASISYARSLDKLFSSRERSGGVGVPTHSAFSTFPNLEAWQFQGEYKIEDELTNCLQADLATPATCKQRGVWIAYRNPAGMCDSLGQCITAQTPGTRLSNTSTGWNRTFFDAAGTAIWTEAITNSVSAPSNTAGYMGSRAEGGGNAQDKRFQITRISRRGSGTTAGTASSLEFTWDSNGRVQTQKMANGTILQSKVALGREEISGPNNLQVRFYSDSRGKVFLYRNYTTATEFVQSRYEYDGLGRIVTAFFEESAGASFKAGCMAAKGSRSNCWRTEYEYDARGNVTKETKYPYAWEGDYWWGHIEITDAAYGTDFNKILWVRGPYAIDTTDPEKDQKKTNYEYDARGLLVKITQPVEYDRPAGVWKAGIQEFQYDPYGRLVREKDAAGRWTDTGYGENGQPIWCQTSKTRSTQPGGLNLRGTATCTTAGDVATATDPKGNVITFTYDAMRQKTAEAAPLGVRKRWIYDLDGNVTTEGAWDGAAWKDIVSTYSSTGKVLTQTDPAGDRVSFNYDALDRVLIKADPEGRQVLTCYNAASQVLEEWRGTGLTISQCGQAVSQASASTPQRYVKNQYGGPNGVITASWDPNNNQTTYAYQGLGKKITTYWPDGKFEHTLYNVTRSDGNVLITRDREGRWTNNHFDKLGRPSVNYSQETPDVFVGSKIHLNYYDSAGNLNWAGTWNHPDWRIQYGKEYDRDAAGRVTNERTYYSFPMDAAGNVTCWACDSSQVTYEYDANDNRTNMRWYQPDLSTIAKRVDYSYDAVNRMTGIAFGNQGAANQGTIAYQYDTLGRRTKVTRGNGTSTEYAYENDSDLDWMRHLFRNGATATAANDNWVGIDYGYDKSGRVNLTSATDSRIMGALPTVGTYGAANNLNQVANVPGRAAMTWSDAGNLKTDGKGTTFTHDGRNRLKRAVKSDGTTLDFLYTVEGYRMESIRNASGTTYSGLPAGGTRTRFLLAGSEEVADLDANRNLIRYFVPGPAIDERVAQIEANGAVTYMHTDRQASVVVITDAAGNVVSRRGYGSYGETNGAQLVGTGSHPFGYTGRRWDPDLGIYYYRARWYDPQTGTFLQTDPIGSLDYINLYAYVGLEPGNATDPTGLNRALVSLGKVVYKGARSGNLKKAGVDEFVEIGSDLGTLVDPNASGLDKAEAAFNLVSPAKASEVSSTLGAVNNAVTNAVKGLRRPYLRKKTIKPVEAAAPRDSSGKPIDPNTNKPIQGRPDIGHKPGDEFWRAKRDAEAEGLTQKQFNDRMNDPNKYQLEDPSSNRSRKYEKKP